MTERSLQRAFLSLAAAAANWIAFGLAGLLTALLLGWVVLAILLALFTLTAGFAAIAARYVASWRSVGLAIALMFASVAVSAVTWALSAPDQALYLARGMALDGSDVRNYLKYPERAISNAPVVFQFPQTLAPQLFQTIAYRQGGQAKQSSFDDFLKATQTTSLIVVKDGTVLYEGYANGYTRDSIITSYSIAKSFTSALIGIAIDERLIGSVDDLMVSYLPELRGKGLDGVTLLNLLAMSAGIHYSHEDEQLALLNILPFNDDSRCTNYPDLRSLVLSVRPSGDAPGKVFEYNNYAPLLLGLILERTTHRPVALYLQEKIWQPLGMEYPASWSLDSERSGFEKMAMGLNARAIDFAKFGVLMLNNGRWRGKHVIPEKWVSASTSPDANDDRRWRWAAAWKEAHGYYKYLWWGRLHPDGSYAFMARGNLQQQWIYVSPRDRMVIVRFGLVDNAADSWPDIFESVAEKIRGRVG